MHLKSVVGFIVGSSVLAASATPLKQLPAEGSLEPRQKKYSVVNVDGGETPTPPPPAVPASTQVVTETQTATPSPAPPAETIHIPEPPPSDPLTETIYVTLVTTQSQSTVTSVMTLVPPQPSSRVEYYDDGKWHTYYRVKSFPGDAGSPSQTSTTSTPCPEESTSTGAQPTEITTSPFAPTYSLTSTTLATAYLPSAVPPPYNSTVHHYGPQI